MGPSWRPVVVLGSALLAAACTVAGPPTRDGQSSAPPAPASAPPDRPTGSPSAAGAPLALVVHRSRPARNVPVRTARSVLSGGVDDWGDLRQEPGRLRLLAGPRVPAPGALRLTSDAAVVAAVAADPRALGLVPAGAVTPSVRALRVGRADPLREPGDYPLTTPGAGPGRVVTVTVVGDVMLGRRVGAAMAASGDFAAPLRPMAQRLAAADVTIANFEATLSRDGAPTQGGDSFAADPRVVEGLRLAGVDVLSLANNHVGDWGSRALVRTVRAVREMGLQPVGAGRSLAQARRPAIVDVGGVRVGVLATDSIGESPAAGRDRPGTNRIDMPPRTGPLDRAALRRVLGDIERIRRDVDLLLVLPHWGTQYTHVAEPVQRRVGRAMVGAGADLVVGGHPHWVQGVQVVDPERGAMVVHSLGNFVFDMDFMRRTQEGVILEALAWDGDLKAIEFVPYVIGADFAPRVVRGVRAAAVLEPFLETSDAPFDAG
jgi:poly-gamma-glutamate synthesis protein (capsule biosynthesis protein)